MLSTPIFDERTQNYALCFGSVQCLIIPFVPVSYIHLDVYKRQALGVCFITQLASDACKDAGEGAIASKVELAGKVVILLLAMPLFEQIIGVATSLMTV